MELFYFHNVWNTNGNKYLYLSKNVSKIVSSIMIKEDKGIFLEM